MKCKVKLARAGCLAYIDHAWPNRRHTDGSQRAEVLDQWHEPQIGVEAYVALHAVRAQSRCSLTTWLQLRWKWHLVRAEHQSLRSQHPCDRRHAAAKCRRARFQLQRERTLAVCHGQRRDKGLPGVPAPIVLARGQYQGPRARV